MVPSTVITVSHALARLASCFGTTSGTSPAYGPAAQFHQNWRCRRLSRERFIQTATVWLRFLGRLQEQQPETPPFADLVQRFDSYLRDERGLSSHTIHNRCWHGTPVHTAIRSRRR